MVNTIPAGTKKLRVLIVSLEPITPYVYGVRSLSSMLNSLGFDTRILFFYPTRYHSHSEVINSEFIKFCSDFNIIGFSFTSSQFSLAVKLAGIISNKLKDKKIIFGGSDSIAEPERNLEISDAVCVGEGEDAFAELLHELELGNPHPHIPGIWYKKDGKVIRTSLRPLNRDFGRRPTVDNNFDRHYVLHKNRIIKFEGKTLNRYLTNNYMTITSFGCSMVCTYCINNRMKDIYSDWGHIRRRPVNHIMTELKDAIQKIPGLRTVDILDDDFCSAPVDYLCEFRDKYTKEIGLPIDIMGIRPIDVNTEKLDILRSMGAVKVRMGIQAVNQESKKLFKRKYSNKFLMNKINILNKYKKTFYGIRYDFIIDTPWDSENASIETLEFISRMPAPFYINVYTLAFYPGTELYKKALKEGIIDASDVWEGKLNKNFMELKSSLVNFMFLLNNLVHISPGFLKLILNHWILKKINTVPKWVFNIVQLSSFIKRGIHYILHGDLAQFRKMHLYLAEYSFLFRQQK